ncbi:MAG: DUF4870 domain-containing protein [Phycisphaerales bacterium JB059]
MTQPTQVYSPKGRLIDPDATSDERTYALLAHLSLLGHVIVPYFAIGIPIVMYLARKNQSPFIDDHTREALNFQITLVLYALVLPVIAGLIGVLTCGVGFILLVPAIIGPYVLGLIGMIMATMAANRGEFFRYPMNFRFIH